MNALDQTFPNELVLTPAYGKQYKTVNDMLNSWKSGTDFKVHKGPYCSIRDFPNKQVNIRIAPGIYCVALS